MFAKKKNTIYKKLTPEVILFLNRVYFLVIQKKLPVK